MTLREVTNQIYDLAVGGQVNGIRFARQELYRYLKNIPLASNGSTTITAVLPDGIWNVKILRFGKSVNSFDYDILDLVQSLPS